MENANPTILTVLPTRQSPSSASDTHPARRRRTGPGHEFDRALYARPHFLRAPFVEDSFPGSGSSSSSGSSSDGDGDGASGSEDESADDVWWDGGDDDVDLDLDYGADAGAGYTRKGYGAANDDEPIDAQEVYDLVSNIADPEHPLSLGQLAVVNLADIQITPSPSPASPLVYVTVAITPTVSHCSHATIIGLAVRVRLERCLPPTHRVDVRVREGTHAQDDQVTKQLADKERVAAALENATLAGVLDTMLRGCDGL